MKKPKTINWSNEYSTGFGKEEAKQWAEVYDASRAGDFGSLGGWDLSLDQAIELRDWLDNAIIWHSMRKSKLEKIGSEDEKF